MSRFNPTARRVGLVCWLLLPVILLSQMATTPPATVLVSAPNAGQATTNEKQTLVPDDAEDGSPEVEIDASWPSPAAPGVVLEFPTETVPEEYTLTTEQLGLGRAISLARPAGQTSIILPIPEGMVLVEFNATLVVPSGLHEAYVSVTINGDTIWAEVVSGGSRVPIKALVEPVSGDATIDIAAEEYFAGRECTSSVIEPKAAELIEPTFELRAQPTLPATVSEFFPQIVDRFDLYVPDERSQGLDEAVLVLAAELSKQYPNLPSFKIHPFSDDLLEQVDPDPFVRSIALREDDEGTVSVIGDSRAAYLEISGPQHHLTSVAASIDSPELGLITTAEADTNGNQVERETERSKRQTLREAGIRTLEANGGVRLQLAMPLPQARFGEPVESIRARLGGVVFHTGASVEEPLVTIWVNGDLFGAVELDESGRFDTEIDISGSNLDRDNLIEVRSDLSLSCGDSLPNHELQLDASSWVEVEYGQTLPVGLERFPQVLLPGFTVDPGESMVELEVTANLLAAMQFVSPEPIEPRVASWAEIVQSERAGILVGGSVEQVDLLGLPIQAGSGSMTVDGVVFDSGTAYHDVAVMQAIVGPSGQDLLHVRLPADDLDSVSTETLAFMLSDRSWEQFQGRAYAVHQDQPLVIPVADHSAEDAALPALRADRPSPVSQSFGAGLLIALAGCLLYLAVRATASRLRR